MSRPVYLDCNATTPVVAEVAEAMLPYLVEHFGNPSSSHSYGKKTAQAVRAARESVARCSQALGGMGIDAGGNRNRGGGVV